MSDINWNENTKRAVSIFYDFIDEQGVSYASPDKMQKDFFNWLAQPERKTVEDAVEYYQENGKICGYSFSQNKMLSFCKSNGTYCFVSEKSSAGSVETDDWQPICTREEFEACVAAKAEGEPHFKATRENLEKIAGDAEGERWTHTYGKNNCYIKVSEPDFQGYIVIYSEVEGYMLVGVRELKPIKPTITNESMKAVESFAYALMDKEDYNLVLEVKTFREAHDITN